MNNRPFPEVFPVQLSAPAQHCGTVDATSDPQRRAGGALMHGLSGHELYPIWIAMNQRCHNPRSTSFSRYGGKGIAVCDAWRDSFPRFLTDMGDRPTGLTLDRIDSRGPYSPDNCRWATYREQARNTSRNPLHTINGVTRCLAEWCEVLGEPWTTVKKRVAAGRDPFVRSRKRRAS
ncbi:MAG: hypothetical protein WKG52_00930 [Variovorax sp.]